MNEVKNVKLKKISKPEIVKSGGKKKNPDIVVRIDISEDLMKEFNKANETISKMNGEITCMEVELSRQDMLLSHITERLLIIEDLYLDLNRNIPKKKKFFNWFK